MDTRSHRPAGYRVYGEDAVERLAFIGAAKHLGLPLEAEQQCCPFFDCRTSPQLNGCAGAS